MDEMPALWAADGPQVCQTAAEQMDGHVSELDGCTGEYLVTVSLNTVETVFKPGSALSSLVKDLRSAAHVTFANPLVSSAAKWEIIVLCS